MRRALEAIEPDVVLVEAPADAGAALRWIGHPGLVPPVALLGYAVDRPEQAVFAPFAEFSPEWQALSWAVARGVPLEAIDLPLTVALAVRAEPHQVAGEVAPDPLAALAAAAGEPDPERWWEDLVEHRGDGEPVFEAVGEAMAAVREGTPTSPLDALREAHMRRAIRAACSGGATVAVVCGAWHVPALDPTVTTVTDDVAILRGRRRVKVAVTWVPWTHRRLGRGTGYGAGVVSPGWYDHVFRHPGADGVSRFFVDAAHALRRHGMPASPDHVIAASRLASSLAALRERPRAGLAEVLDASESVLGGLPLVLDELVVGEAIGEVPPEAPQVPLARDLAAAQRAARLKPESSTRRIELDLRTANGLRRSHLLHRLVALGVPWGTLEEGRGSSGTFRETWSLTWEPELSVRVVELAGHGTTVQAAATSRLVELEHVLDVGRLADAAAAVELALLADLGEALETAVRVLGELAAHAPDVAELMDALGPLAGALRYGDVRGTDARSLRVVFDELVVRVVAGLGRAAAGLDDDAARAMIERMSAVQAALAIVDHPARHADWLPVLEQTRRRQAHPWTRPGPRHPAAARRRPVVARRCRGPPRAGAHPRHPGGRRGGVRRGLPRRQRHRPAPRRPPPGGRRRLDRVVARRHVRDRRRPVAPHVRRASSPPSAGSWARSSPPVRSSAWRRWATTSTRPGRARAWPRCGRCSACPIASGGQP